MEIIDKQTKEYVAPVEYGIDEKDLQQQAEKNLKHGNKEFQKLEKELQKLDYRHDFVKINLCKTKMKVMMEQEVDRLWLLEMNKRKSVKGITELLSQKDANVYDEWQNLIAALTFLLDITDTVFSDINKLLRRNNVGIDIYNFPELNAARKIAWEMASKEQNSIPVNREAMWSEESERLYKYLKERCVTYRRKLARAESKKINLTTDTSLGGEESK